MFKAIKEFFMGKPEPVAAPQEPVAPYKVEAPAFKPTADAAPVVETPAPTAKKSAAPKAKQPAAKKPAAPRKSKAPAA
jgi:hypothetical protein